MCRQLCECILQFEDAWEEKGIELETDLEDRALVEADERLLELVWNNLFSNAVKFTEPGGKIKVTQTSAERFVKVSVSDTGCGMDQDSMKHIFDKFYQGILPIQKKETDLAWLSLKECWNYLTLRSASSANREKAVPFL